MPESVLTVLLLLGLILAGGFLIFFLVKASKQKNSSIFCVFCATLGATVAILGVLLIGLLLTPISETVKAAPISMYNGKLYELLDGKVYVVYRQGEDGESELFPFSSEYFAGFIEGDENKLITVLKQKSFVLSTEDVVYQIETKEEK